MRNQAAAAGAIILQEPMVRAALMHIMHQSLHVECNHGRDPDCVDDVLCDTGANHGTVNKHANQYSPGTLIHLEGWLTHSCRYVAGSDCK